MRLFDDIAEQNAAQQALQQRMAASRKNLLASISDDADFNTLLAQRQAAQTAASRPLAGASAPQTAGRSSGSAPLTKPSGNVAQWINQALALMHLDPSYAPGIANMIKRESGGNPNAVNNWDSNAKAGHPSKGLMQTIDSTFNAHAMPGHTNIFNPVDNIIAAVDYARKRYGDAMVKSGGRKNSAGKYIGY